MLLNNYYDEIRGGNKEKIRLLLGSVIEILIVESREVIIGEVYPPVVS